jgi:hypothetical protein
MKSTEPSQQQGGWFSSFVRWWATPYSHRYHFSRSDPRIMLLLAVGAVAGMIVGGTNGLWIGLLVLWYLSKMLIPALCGDALTRWFGDPWGTILAFAPLWLSVVLAVTAKLWLPLFGIH